MDLPLPIRSNKGSRRFSALVIQEREQGGRASWDTVSPAPLDPQPEEALSLLAAPLVPSPSWSDGAQKRCDRISAGTIIPFTRQKLSTTEGPPNTHSLISQSWTYGQCRKPQISSGLTTELSFGIRQRVGQMKTKTVATALQYCRGDHVARHLNSFTGTGKPSTHK